MKDQLAKVIKERGLGALSAYHVSILFSMHVEGHKFMVDFTKRKVTGGSVRGGVCVRGERVCERR